MQLKPDITFRRVRRSEELDADVLRRIGKLETYYRPITACHVLIEFSERRHGAGNRYRVRIQLDVPGSTILVRHEASQRANARALGLPKLTRVDEPDPGHKYARVAIREAFEVARRRLQDYARKRRGAVKTHAAAVRRSA